MPLSCFLKTLSYSRMIEQDQGRRWTDAKFMAPHVPKVEHFPAEAITIEFCVFLTISASSAPLLCSRRHHDWVDYSCEHCSWKVLYQSLVLCPVQSFQRIEEVQTRRCKDDGYGREG